MTMATRPNDNHNVTAIAEALKKTSVADVQ
jgi:hypothetical protein